MVSNIPMKECILNKVSSNMYSLPFYPEFLGLPICDIYPFIPMGNQSELVKYMKSKTSM